MRNLHDMIDERDMIGVKVDTGNIFKVMQRMNARIKQQELRIQAFESEFSNKLSADAFRPFEAATNDRLSKIEKKIEGITQKLIYLENLCVKSNEELKEQTESKVNDIILTTQISLNNISDGMDAQMFQIRDNCNDLKARIQVQEQNAEKIDGIGVRLDYLYNLYKQKEETEKENRDQFTLPDNYEQPLEKDANLICDLKQKIIDEIRNSQTLKEKPIISRPIIIEIQERPKLPKEKFIFKNDQKPQIIERETNQIPDLFTDLVNQHSELIGKTMDITNNLIERVENLEHRKYPEITEVNDEIKEEKPQKKLLIRHTDGLSKDNDFIDAVNGIGNQINDAKSEIDQIKANMEENGQNIRDVVGCMLEEFNIIHGNANGLENIPPLNFAKCVPSFFNNPSFTSLLGSSRTNTSQDNSQQSIKSETNSISDIMENDDEVPPNNIIIDTPEHPGTIREEASVEIKPPSPLIETKAPKKIESVKIVISEKKSPNKPSMTKSEPKKESKIPHPAVRPKQINNNNNIPTPTVDKAVIEEITSMLDAFHRDKDELMTAVDHKVDRELVEKIFNKFRVITNEINERLKILTKVAENSVPKEEFEKIIQILAHLPEMSDNTSAMKKSGHCLFCGKERTKVTGEISPIEAIAGNIFESPPFVYGEGGAYQRGFMKNFPNIPLPPLGAQTQINTERT